MLITLGILNHHVGIEEYGGILAVVGDVDDTDGERSRAGCSIEVTQILGRSSQGMQTFLQKERSCLSLPWGPDTPSPIPAF